MKEMIVKDNFINLSDVKEIPHPELFREVAKVIAEDTLQYINEHDTKVEPKKSFYTKYGKRFIDHRNIILCIGSYFADKLNYCDMHFNRCGISDFF